MKTIKEENNRRDFLKKCGLSTASILLPVSGLTAMSSLESPNGSPSESKTPVNFIYDGLALSPQEYLEKLNQINKEKPIEPDFYGNGGATKIIEEEFARITGKEKAIYLPTGTMANQLAIKLLNGNNTKVIVPENSHIFRDEADAAQSVHNKRLIPVGKGKPYFNLDDLKNTIDYTNTNEVFKSGLGTVAIENPVRRADGTSVPIKDIKEISEYCKEHGYKMHLDGARLHIASAFNNISVSEYASYFDTVYISLYKYLNATGGAILCGDAEIIDQVSHQIKILGGTVFQSWNHTSVALHYLNGINKRWNEILKTSKAMISELNKIDGVSIVSLQNGTNIYDLTLNEEISLKKLAIFLYNEHSIWLGRSNEKGVVKFTVNESLLTRDYDDIMSAWKKGIEHART
ncbi:aminotransferase class I/II-fold pyridoxal phosphate-dependent enzyme [Aureisphaera galaxeae]|uniref:threonine aldolase family protein n=1 Tax=Aureisphaera galaxeae TaxID=1538023 RepID=UPI002350E7BA|nr:aminotransferase class I/II-fold pyridoxal phosphate-dependent enzyme [Aureisphaera galaxeae]MDC8004847.1 aminotransferase class I/II-fold pyridoxal phosphate-dependent enzyme [Aureisphaera galaxeae]